MPTEPETDETDQPAPNPLAKFEKALNEAWEHAAWYFENRLAAIELEMRTCEVGSKRHQMLQSEWIVVAGLLQRFAARVSILATLEQVSVH